MEIADNAFQNNFFGLNVLRLIEGYIDYDRSGHMEGFEFNQQLKKQIRFDLEEADKTAKA